MTDDEAKILCLALLRADSEEHVIRLLSERGFWDKDEYWRYYGDEEDNFATTGNQQSRPEAALVEKVVNSVDAVLMGKCWLSGVSPEDAAAPTSIYEAVALYFCDDSTKQDTLGHIGYWTTQKRTDVSRLITIAATGEKSNPSFTIADAGEGQTPNRMPITLLDLSHKNKLGVHFVQGKFNMGGTGVFQFCGKHNLQLIITRRNPNIRNDRFPDDSFSQWGFTVVRRENPTPGRKSSVYTYLAPLGINQKPQQGGVLRFQSETLPIFPEGRNPYRRASEWGTVVKLYEYKAAGFRTNMMLRDGLLSRLDLLLPSIALPIRLYECRDYGGFAERSFETTLSGLSVRLEDNKAQNLEDGFPAASPLAALGENMTVKIYAFKKGRAQTYRKNEGIIFTVNGQTHAHLSLTFFSRTKVGMHRLDDSVLVVVDCTNLTGRAREDLFMNSRDRLRNGELREEIERELEILIRDHSGLKALRERRRSEEIQEKLVDSKPLEDTLKLILRSSPSLSALFLAGTRLSNPFKSKQVTTTEKPWQGKLHPTYFKFQRIDYGQTLNHATPINMRSRITFETDVVNDYFDRLQTPGKFTLCAELDGISLDITTYSLNLQNGKATLNLRLPRSISVGDSINYTAKVQDDTLVFPFTNVFVVTVGQQQDVKQSPQKISGKPPAKESGDERDAPSGVQFPEVTRVYEQDWSNRKHRFDQYSALEIIQESAGGDNGDEDQPIYSFWINMDNIYLKTEKKYSKNSVEIIDTRYEVGLTLLGLALIQSHIQSEKSQQRDEEGGRDEEKPTLEENVYRTTAAVAPILLPLIDSLGSLTEEKGKIGGQAGDDD
jgi:hypothetical protein